MNNLWKVYAILAMWIPFAAVIIGLSITVKKFDLTWLGIALFLLTAEVIGK